MNTTSICEFDKKIGPLLRLAQHAAIKVLATDGSLEEHPCRVTVTKRHLYTCPGAEFRNRSIAYISDEKPTFCIFTLKE
jgi:hypothetical protein